MLSHAAVLYGLTICNTISWSIPHWTGWFQQGWLCFTGRCSPASYGAWGWERSVFGGCGKHIWWLCISSQKQRSGGGRGALWQHDGGSQWYTKLEWKYLTTTILQVNSLATIATVILQVNPLATAIFQVNSLTTIATAALQSLPTIATVIIPS